MTRLPGGLLASVAPLVVTCAYACPITPTYSYYSVEGNTAEQLEESLRLKGPRDDFGAVRFAYTHWTVEWDWKLTDRGHVDPHSVELKCLATVMLPMIKERDVVAADLLAAWDGFVKRTERHELNHVKHVEELAPQIVKRLHRAAPRGEGISVKVAESIVADGIARIRAKDREYDRATSHGKTEGTWRIVVGEGVKPAMTLTTAANANQDGGSTGDVAFSRGP